ncbi:hypothetical protein LUZ60_009025 [Juncus effusus]|nr:hypothetical protein LUZ60_009025 [Juncus effusus]
MKLQICPPTKLTHSAHRSKVPPGHVPVQVGEATEPPERFAVRVELLNRPVFAGLLDQTAQEFGYQQAGALRILCDVSFFRSLLSALSSGDDGGAGVQAS